MLNNFFINKKKKKIKHHYYYLLIEKPALSIRAFKRLCYGIRSAYFFHLDLYRKLSFKFSLFL